MYFLSVAPLKVPSMEKQGKIGHGSYDAGSGANPAGTLGNLGGKKGGNPGGTLPPASNIRVTRSQQLQ